MGRMIAARHMGVLVLLVAAALWASAHGAGAAEAPAATPQPQEAPLEWGPPSGGLAAALALEGEAAVGGRFAFRLALRSAAGDTVTLPPAKDAFGWIVIAQNFGDSKTAFYSEKIPMTAAGDTWPANLTGEAAVRLKAFDLSATKVYPSSAARQLLMAYLTGKDDAGLGPPAGLLNEAPAAGRAMAKFTLCLPTGGAKPALVITGPLALTIGPPTLAAMKPEDREAFLADLLKQFDRNPWAGQQAHDTAVRLGPAVVPTILKAAFETGRPGHARLWLATTLADIRDGRCVDALVKLLDDPMDGVRYVVAYHGPKQQDATLDKAVVEKVRTAETPALAAWALLGFMVHRSTVPEEVLKAGLESDDPRARTTVAEALAQHASEFNVVRLVGLLGDANERVRGVAAKMLGQSGNRSPAVTAALVKALDLPGETARQRVCQALSQLAGKDLPYDPKADPTARAATLAAWKAWWAEKRPRE